VADRYLNYSELAAREVEGRDFRVRTVPRPSPVLVMAPHGGNIEPYTDGIAGAIAGADFGFYAFEGMKTHDELHIASHRFDEPRALAAVTAAAVVLTVHGCRNTERGFVCVGGLHDGLRSAMEESLRSAGFRLEDLPGMRGRSPENICNRGWLGRGVQLEISYALRRHLVENEERYDRFVTAVRAVLLG